MQLESLASGTFQSCVAKFIAQIEMLNQLCCCEHTARNTGACHHAEGLCRLALAPLFLATITVVLLVSAVELQQLSVRFRELIGFCIGQILGDRTSKKATFGLDFFNST